MKKKERPYNGGTMTQAEFFQWIRQILRKSSVYWKPISQARKEAQVPYKGTSKRRKYSYVCSVCKKEFPATSINVHHIEECGSLSSFEDISEFTRKLFVEKDGLMVVCNDCHDKIHNKESKNGKHINASKRRVVKPAEKKSNGRGRKRSGVHTSGG